MLLLAIFATFLFLFLLLYIYRILPSHNQLSTSLRSFMAIYSMPHEKIQSFMASYSLFDEEVVTKENEDKISDYYGILNILCSIGDVEKMYIPPVIESSVGISRNQDLFEEKMMRDLDLEAGYKVLEMGCGRGRVAAHVAAVSGVEVTGINIEPTQVQLGNEHARRMGLQGRVKIIKYSFNDLPLPFPDDSFDAIYEIQALTYTEGGNFERLFRECFRVMKPGAKLSFLDWVRLSNFNPRNADHKALLSKVKPLLGAVFTPSVEEYVLALERSGFRIVSSGIPGASGFQYPLIERAVHFFVFLGYVVNVAVFLRILPRHFKVLLERFNKDGMAFIKGDRERLWTSVWQIVAQKPQIP